MGQRFLGQEFELASPDGGASGRKTLELVPLDPDVAPPPALAPTAPTEAPLRYGLVEDVRVVEQWIEVVVEGLDASAWPRFDVPSWDDHTPESWWFVETLTGIAAERVVKGWEDGENVVLEDAVRLLSRALHQYCRVPIRRYETGDAVDRDRWRREVVRLRFIRGLKPFVFLSRPDHLLERTRAVLTDVAGDYLFRTSAEAGESLGQPALIRTISGKTGIQRLERAEDVRGLLVRSIRFARPGRPPRPACPPDYLLADLMTCPDASWPVLDGLVRIPTVRADGTILEKPGYDAASRLWYAPDFVLEPVPERPTARDILEAKRLIETPFAEFPFLDPSARSAVYAALFEQLVRPMITGPRPLYVFEAPDHGQGSGKSLCAKVIQGIITGAAPFTSSLGRREEETEKRILTFLRQQRPVVILDNLVGDLQSETLQQIATSESWQARILGQSEAPILRQSTTWILTLNAARMTPDLVRRCVMMQLDTRLAVAYKRTGFRIEDVLTWAIERRAAIIRACLVLIRAWVAAGRPRDPAVVRGSFESWCHVLGGIVLHAGFASLAGALEATTVRDVLAEDHQLFVRSWAERYPDHLVPASTLGRMAQELGLYEEHLGNRRGVLALGKVMRRILNRLVGTIVEGYRVDRNPTKLNGTVVYRLSRTE
jgi:hypothetical protein